ncbi:MAG: hypothetical protein DME60_12100 [Verrucomicrobia bacterium]|nr:MAG: hypothetical protein DME60_12100 [Verrucomicrobiota bacterium]
MLDEHRRAVIVVARIGRLNARIGLRRQRTHYVRQCIVRQPTHAIVVGLARPHPVTRNRWATAGAARALPCVVPGGKEGARVTDRKVGLPLRTRRGISVQLEWRAKTNPPVGRADVIDIPSVSASAVLSIDEVNDLVVGGRLTPTLVPPVATAIGKHARKVAHSGNARPGKGGSSVGGGPGVAPVGGPVEVVDVVVGEPSAAFVHPGDVDVAVDLVTGDLDVADEGDAGGDLSLVGPGDSVVSGEADKDALATTEVIPGDVHPPVEGRGYVVVRIARLSVIAAAAVNAVVMGPTIRVPGSGGLVSAQALTAAGSVKPHSVPSVGWPVEENNGVAHGIRERALTAGEGEAAKGGAAVGGDRSPGDVDGAGVAAS